VVVAPVVPAVPVVVPAVVPVVPAVPRPAAPVVVVVLPLEPAVPFGFELSSPPQYSKVDDAKIIAAHQIGAALFIIISVACIVSRCLRVSSRLSAPASRRPY
jgi:hypothetical protein